MVLHVLHYYIKDPKGNRLQQYLNANPEMGVFAGSFQLSTLISMGIWKLIVEQGVCVDMIPIRYFYM